LTPPAPDTPLTDFPPSPPRRGSDLGPGEVHVWSVDLDPPPALAAALGRLLAPDERERAARFRFDEHRRRYAVGRGALRTLLGAYVGERPEALRFGYGPRGKPELADFPALGFNLSNSEDLALVGVLRGREIGVDVEYMKPMPDLAQIAERFFCAAETAKLLALPEERRREAFFNCWTRKEAYLKAVGEGLAAPLDSFEVTLTPDEEARMLFLKGDAGAAERWFYRHLRPAPDYIGALTIEGEPGESWAVRPLRFTV
jgi:4'-phosphopantetheinyl transferase